MQRKKQHRAILKGLMRDERTTPHRALLAEHILKCLDAIDDDALRMYEIAVMSSIGDYKLVDYYFERLNRCTDKPVKSLLKDPADHITIQNARQRDFRSHPNWRFILEIEALNEDADTEHERLFYTTIFLTSCYDASNRFKLIDRFDDGVPHAHENANGNGQVDAMRQYIEGILLQGEK